MPFLLAAHVALIALAVANVAYLRRTRRDRVPLPDPPPRLSVLVPARNEEENLARLLPTLLVQDHPDFEVVVVDDASEDRTWDVLQAHADHHLHPVRSAGPPPGWVGKVHALHQAAQAATGATFLFLDADAALTDPGALVRLAERHAALGAGAVLSGLPRYTDRGAALLLTSLVPFAILAGLPAALVPRTRNPALSALNGQAWMIAAEDYRKNEPHAAHPAEVLEDVQIGRYLKTRGLRLYMRDLGGEVEVRMYGSFAEAWRGFRKNAYLLAGGQPLSFLAFQTVYVLLFVAAPWIGGWPLLVTLVALKGIADRFARLPLWVTALAPLALACGAALGWDSARAHLAGHVAWKGREVGAGR